MPPPRFSCGKRLTRFARGGCAPQSHRLGSAQQQVQVRYIQPRLKRQADSIADAPNALREGVGDPLGLKCSAEVNSASAKVCLRQTLDALHAWGLRPRKVIGSVQLRSMSRSATSSPGWSARLIP